MAEMEERPRRADREREIRTKPGSLANRLVETTLACRLLNFELLDFKSIPQKPNANSRFARSGEERSTTGRTTFLLSRFRYLDCIVSARGAISRERREESEWASTARNFDGVEKR
jgi:hypothetical protein